MNAERTGRAGAAGLSVVGLQKRFGAVVAVDRVSLDVGEGELLAVVGPSGCGKTTLLRMVAGLERPDAGRVFIQGQDVSDLPPERRDVGFVFQQFALFPNMSVAANVEYGLKRKRVPRAERRRRVEEMLELVGLAALAGRRPDQLSAGQQQRVALARALAPRPKTLLLDEPLSALDAAIRTRLRDDLRAMQRRLGITTVLVTHDQEEALAIADRVAVMNDGRVEQAGTPWELYDRPRTAFVAAFIGRANLLTGRIDGDVVDLGPLGRVPKVSLPGAGETADGPVRFLVRPEAVAVRPWAGDGEVLWGAADPWPGMHGQGPSAFEPSSPAPAAYEPPFPSSASRRPTPESATRGRLMAKGVIVDVVFGGERSLVKILIDGQEWLASVVGGQAHALALRRGEAALVAIHPEAVRILPVS